MLVTRVIGDCPGCGGKKRFGNVSVRGGRVIRGCVSCKYRADVWLPEIRKKIIYLDQFFFSHAFRAREKLFVHAAQRIAELSSLQLLAAPFSSVHEDETHQWRGYGQQNKEDLMEFIKATSRGHEFKPDYDVQQTQILRAFRSYLDGRSTTFVLEDDDAFEDSIHEWDDYFRIDVGRYIADIEGMRDLKRQSIESLVDSFPGWRQSTNTFEQDVLLEVQASAKGYLRFYVEYAARIARGDHNALFDSPIMSTVVQSMLYCFPDNVVPEHRLSQIVRFFESEHFAAIPYQLLSAQIFAVLKDMVKCGAYTNRKNALNRLSGFFLDVKHVATYAPYCDAFVVDQAMASLVADSRIGLENRYQVKIFSLKNWKELLTWLDELQATMTNEHKAGLAAAYS